MTTRRSFLSRLVGIALAVPLAVKAALTAKPKFNIVAWMRQAHAIQKQRELDGQITMAWKKEGGRLYRETGGEWSLAGYIPHDEA